MDLSSRTVLVTGGGSGIGLGLARRLRAAGSRVIVCGRRADRLREVEAAEPGIGTRVCDLADEAGRRSLVDWAVAEYPELDVLVNNAGIQRRVDFAAAQDAAGIRAEIADQPGGADPSRLARHSPFPAAPERRDRQRHVGAVVLAARARGGLLRDEGRPPFLHVVATQAARGHSCRGRRDHSTGRGHGPWRTGPSQVRSQRGRAPRFRDAGEREIAYGFAQQSSRASREELDRIFERMNQPE